MDLSDPSSTDSSDLDTMGNILATSSENNAQADETGQAEDEPCLTSENVEVSECQNEKILDISTDIDLLSIGKSSHSVIEQSVLPQTSSSVDNLNISESDDNVEDLWLTGETRELVKVETDEDFDVIVKSLETAIVGADKLPMLSPILVPESSVESDLCDPVLLESLPSISELDVETSKLQSDVSDQCLESLIDTSIITGEFTAISDDTFDGESSSLFETTDAVSEFTNIDSRPSLLALQEADMTCDITEAINKDVLPLIKDTLLNEDSLDSTEDILNNIVNKNINSEVQIEETVDEEILEFPETEDTLEMSNKSIELDQQVLTEKSVEIEGQEIVEKREEIHSETNATEENVDKSEENVDKVTKTDKSDSECEKVLAKEEEIMEQHEAKSEIDIVNIENLTDVDIFDKTEEMIANEVNIPLEMTQEDEPEDNSSENKTEEEIINDLEPDVEENINSVPLELTESPVVSSQSEIKAEAQRVEAEISETLEEQLPGEENLETLSVTLENVRLENVSVGLEENLNKVQVVLDENVDKVRVVSEESADNSSVKVDENKTSVIMEESVDSSRVLLENQLSLTVEENIIVNPDKRSIHPEQIATVLDSSQVTSVKPQLDEPKSTALIEKVKDNENNHTSTSSSDTQNSIVEDQVRQASDTVEKEQSPPKKIKLIREKLYIPPPVNISTVLPPLDVTAKVVSSENVTESNNSDNIKITSAEIIDAVAEPKDQQFVEKSSPVRTQKLKLKRDYEPEQIVTRPEADLIKSEDCVTEDMPSVASEEESVKPTMSVTVQCESPNIIEEPKVEQDNKIINETELKIDQEIKIVSETDLKTDEDIKIVSETDLKTDEDIKIVSETDLKADEEIDTAVENDLKDTQMITEAIKSAETPLVEVNLESLTEISVSKQLEVPEDGTITNEMPITCAIDVPTALDNDVPIIEDIPEAGDAEKPSKSPESLPDCEETPAGIISNSPEQADLEESPEKFSKSPESLPDCEETSTGIISNSPEQANLEESPENSCKSPESLPDWEETLAAISSQSPEQANPEESPENSLKSPQSVSDCEETFAGIISQSPEQVNPEENSSPILVTSTEVLPEKIVEETVAICEEKSSDIEKKSSGTEETPLVAPETIRLPAETKLSILQQMLMKDVVAPTKEKSRCSSVVDLPGVEPIKEFETLIVRSENELATSEIERADELIDDELLQAAKAVETRIDASEENDDELKQAAQEAETRDEHAEAPLEATEAEFEDNSVSICEDEIIAVTQALEMERAQENRVEISKTESLLGICKEKTVEPTVRKEIVPKPSLIIEQIQDKVHEEVEDNKLKRHIVETIPAVAAKKSKSNKDAETTIGRKQKSSPVTKDSIDAIEVAGKQSVTIEPVSSQSGVENVGKLRISRRKLEEPVLAKSVTITKPLRVEVDDLGHVSMSPSYFSDLPPQRDAENVPKIVIKPIPKPEERSSPKITIKPILKPSEMILSPKISKSKSSDDACTPRITIKPIMKPDPLKITITKQKMDDTHSILKIYKPDDGINQFEEKIIPKLTIKPIGKCDEMQHSPRITIKPVKPPSQHSPSTSMSPKITVKPVMPPNDQCRLEMSHSPKITVKSVQNPEDSYPKVTIKPILRPDDSPRGSMSPRQVKLKTMTFESSSGVTVEPIAQLLQNVDTQMTPLKISVKSFAKIEETLSPKLTIKPITKTCEIVQSEDGSSNPLKLTIKPILKPEESYQSPKITIKPILKPEKMDQTVEEMDKPERIILKIQKTNLPSPKERAAHSKESRKEPEVKIEAILQDPDRNQKLDKIKLKLTKEGSHAQIIPSVPSMLSEQFTLKRPLLFSESSIAEKRSKGEFSGTELLHNSDISINLVEPNAKPHPKTISEEVTIVKLDRSSGSVASPLAEHISQSKFKEMLLKIQQKADITCTPHIEDNSSSSDDVKIVGVGILSGNPLKDPLSIHDESSSQDVVIVNEVINTNPFHNVQIINAHTISDASAQQTPKKRGRPRKNPLEVKPEIKGEDCVEIVRPKRTCRAPPGRTPFAVKERKPRGAGRGRGGRGRGGASPKSPKEPKTPRGKALKEAKALAKLEAAKLAQEVVIDEITIENSTNDTTPIATPVPPIEDVAKKPLEEQEMAETEVKLSQVSEELLKEPQQHLPPPIAVYEEETRMSADNSRAQTPARQVIAAPQLEGPEESQSSVQSSATTESNKNKKGRLEVCDPDSAVTTVEQIVEYSWGAGGTYMLQEQIAQFLGVKSFKRKYPGLTRRPVEMQERDYIREKGLVSESMCDMGLTAVPSSEILDIMYTDFQEKYEEYRKCMRDKQSKEISNKQKAISLATSQEKNKIDFKERAIRSAANWNVNFNKSRKESRRCCMDLQTFTINFPLGRTQCKAPQKSPVGQYPIALVPGQFTDYYKRYTSNELHYLPLNTVRYGPVMPNQHCTDAGQSDGSQSDTDSSSGSDSDSSDDSMSTVEDTPANAAGFGKPSMNVSLATPKAKVH